MAGFPFARHLGVKKRLPWKLPHLGFCRNPNAIDENTFIEKCLYNVYLLVSSCFFMFVFLFNSSQSLRISGVYWRQLWKCSLAFQLEAEPSSPEARARRVLSWPCVSKRQASQTTWKRMKFFQWSSCNSQKIRNFKLNMWSSWALAAWHCTAISSHCNGLDCVLSQMKNSWTP